MSSSVEREDERRVANDPSSTTQNDDVERTTSSTERPPVGGSSGGDGYNDDDEENAALVDVSLLSHESNSDEGVETVASFGARASVHPRDDDGREDMERDDVVMDDDGNYVALKKLPPELTTAGASRRRRRSDEKNFEQDVDDVAGGTNGNDRSLSADAMEEGGEGTELQQEETSPLDASFDSNLSTCAVVDQEGDRGTDSAGMMMHDREQPSSSRADSSQAHIMHHRRQSTVRLSVPLESSFSSEIGVDSADRQEREDDYVRRGTRLRDLVRHALRKVAEGFAEDDDAKDAESREGDDGDEESIMYDDENNPIGRRGKRRSSSLGNGQGEEGPARTRRRRNAQQPIDSVAADLAREKAQECIRLQRALKEAESHAAALEATKSTLQDAAATSSSRMDRTLEALRIATANAANARADADAAEARASSLSTQLQSMRSVLDETKRACEEVRGEHEEISHAARSVEARLVQTESEMARMEREKRRAEEDRDELRDQADRSERMRKLLQDDLDKSQNEAVRLKKKIAEQEAVDEARMDRTHRVEKDLSNTKKLLIDTTSGLNESEGTIENLRNTIRELQRQNENLHDKIEENRDTAAKERARLNEALTASESEAQRLRMKAEEDEEELQRLRLDKVANEKEIGQLKSRKTNLEKRLTAATTSSTRFSDSFGSTVTPSPPSSNLGSINIVGGKTPSDVRSGSVGDTGSKGTSTGVVIPPLGDTLRTPKILPGRKSFGGGKENRPIIRSKCCLCFKDFAGMWKNCQCGKATCDKRAHASCIAGKGKITSTSVSHPGTPAPPLPTILCSGTWSK